MWKNARDLSSGWPWENQLWRGTSTMGLRRWSGLLLDQIQRKELTEILLPMVKNPHVVRNERIRDNAGWCIRANIYKRCSRSHHVMCAPFCLPTLDLLGEFS